MIQKNGRINETLQEDTAILKRKCERLKKIEMASDMDEILKEEIREYKETLTCPSCKVIIYLQRIILNNDKYLCFSGEAKGCHLDQVLPCLLLRLPANALRDEVENQRTNKQKTKTSIHRQRKCPKCNAAFGASDYHRCLNTCIFHKYSSVFFTNTIFLLCLVNIIPPQALPFVSDPNKNKKEEAVLTGFSLEWMS